MNIWSICLLTTKHFWTFAALHHSPTMKTWNGSRQLASENPNRFEKTLSTPLLLTRIFTVATKLKASEAGAQAEPRVFFKSVRDLRTSTSTSVVEENVSLRSSENVFAASETSPDFSDLVNSSCKSRLRRLHWSWKPLIIFYSQWFHTEVWGFSSRPISHTHTHTHTQTHNRHTSCFNESSCPQRLCKWGSILVVRVINATLGIFLWFRSIVCWVQRAECLHSSSVDTDRRADAVKLLRKVT